MRLGAQEIARAEDAAFGLFDNMQKCARGSCCLRRPLLRAAAHTLTLTHRPRASRYYQARAKLVTKVRVRRAAAVVAVAAATAAVPSVALTTPWAGAQLLKHPHISDYRQAVMECDETEAINLRLCALDLRCVLCGAAAPAPAHCGGWCSQEPLLHPVRHADEGAQPPGLSAVRSLRPRVTCHARAR